MSGRKNKIDDGIADLVDRAVTEKQRICDASEVELMRGWDHAIDDVIWLELQIEKSDAALQNASPSAALDIRDRRSGLIAKKKNILLRAAAAQQNEVQGAFEAAANLGIKAEEEAVDAQKRGRAKGTQNNQVRAARTLKIAEAAMDEARLRSLAEGAAEPPVKVITDSA